MSKDAAQDILALLRGEAGPFLESETSFFGQKRVDPSMKDKPMETDCGGMIITKAKNTYGQADELARRVDLTDFPEFLSQIEPSCYWKVGPDGRVFIGDAWWSVYSYLTTKEYICSMTPASYGKGHPQKRGPETYDNSMEYLYDEVLKRLVKAGVFVADSQWRFFSIGPNLHETAHSV